MHFLFILKALFSHLFIIPLYKKFVYYYIDFKTKWIDINKTVDVEPVKNLWKVQFLCISDNHLLISTCKTEIKC